MSAITTPPRPPVAPLFTRGPASSKAISGSSSAGVGWDLYDRLSEAIGEGQHIRLAYDGKDLEIMTTGPVHEDYKERLGQIVATVSKTLGIPRQEARGDNMEASRDRARDPGRPMLLLRRRQAGGRQGRPVPASPTTSPIIPTPIWRSRSISPTPRSTGPASMLSSGSPRSGGSTARPW